MGSWLGGRAAGIKLVLVEDARVTDSGLTPCHDAGSLFLVIVFSECFVFVGADLYQLCILLIFPPGFWLVFPEVICQFYLFVFLSWIMF